MTRLTLHNLETAPEPSKALVARSKQLNGYLPNLIGILANSPHALQTYVTVGEINSQSTLSLAQREVVQITAARIHGCDFCLAGHSALALGKAGLSKQQVVALQNGLATGDPSLDAVLAFASSVIHNRGAVTDAELASFFSSGYTQSQALEVVLGISLATLCNFSNTLAQSPVNPQLEAFRAGVLQA